MTNSTANSTYAQQSYPFSQLLPHSGYESTLVSSGVVGTSVWEPTFSTFMAELRGEMSLFLHPGQTKKQQISCQSLQVDDLKAELEEVRRRNQSLQADLNENRKERSKSTGAEPDRYLMVTSLFISVKSKNLYTW